MKAAKKHSSWDKVDRLAQAIRKQRAALLGDGLELLEPAGARVRAVFTDPSGKICENLPHLRRRIGEVFEADDFNALLAKVREMVR